MPSDTSSNGRLLYGSITNKPIRGAVQVIASAAPSVLASGTSKRRTGTCR
ncbi:MAG: hypothetical protein U1F25_13010 [Rubrivivax sp.]